jgi:hypothetical protein
MASQEKLNSASAFAIGELSLASTLIIDGLLDEALQAKLTQHGIETIRADAVERRRPEAGPAPAFTGWRRISYRRKSDAAADRAG